MIRGLVFDFDGLMVDTEAPALQSWLEIFQEYECEFPLALWSSTLGGSGTEFDPCTYLDDHNGQSVDPSALRARRKQRKLELAMVQPLLPGVLDYILSAKQLGLRLAVASSNTRQWVVGHLNRLDVIDQFDAIVTSDIVSHVKPDPEIYLAAVAQLDLQPQQAIALEDAPNGLLAARRAGLFCIAVPNPLTRDLPLDHANLRLTSLADLPLEALLAKVATHREEWGKRSVCS